MEFVIIIFLLIILVISLVVLGIGRIVQNTRKTDEPIIQDQSTKKSDDSDIHDQLTKPSWQLTDHELPSHEQSPQTPINQLRHRFTKDEISKQNHETEENHTELDKEDKCSISAVSTDCLESIIHSHAQLLLLFCEQRV